MKKMSGNKLIFMAVLMAVIIVVSVAVVSVSALGDNSVQNLSESNLIDTIKDNFEIKFSSIRTEGIALRYRGAINRTFFRKFNSENGSEYILGEYQIYSVGILVNTSDAQSLTRTNARDAWAWKDGQFNTTNNGWGYIAEDTDNYYFAAAIVGYEDQNGAIAKTTANTNLYFRAYIELVDKNNNKQIVYIDPETGEYGIGTNNYGTTLARTADGVAVSQTEPGWVSEKRQRAETIEKILNAAANTTYSINCRKDTGAGSIHSYPVTTGSTANYQIVVVPKAGYVVNSIKVGSTTYNSPANNKVTVKLSGATTVEAKYSRIDSSVLDARRQTVLNKMTQITTTKFRYTSSYKNYYVTSSLNKTVYGYNDTSSGYTHVQHQGMPYCNVATVSYDAFIEDFTTGPVNGIYTVKDIGFTGSDGRLHIWGNNCADTVYWSWATVSSSISCTVSGNFTDKFGCLYVGDYEVTDSDLDSNGNFVNQKTICTNNGTSVMYNAYSLMKPGDAMVCNGHVILVKSISVVYNNDGSINPTSSKLYYYEQNTGDNTVSTSGGTKTISTCKDNASMLFSSLYSSGYLPVSCAELVDENANIATPVVTDSRKTYGKSYVTSGDIEANYYFSKVKMEITDSTGETHVYTRYRDETNPKKIQMSWFRRAYATEYSNVKIYQNNVFNINSLPKGTTRCVVTAYLGNGYSQVVRDFTFTN